MRDADMQQAEFERLGNQISRLRKQGICTHGWLQTKPIVTCKHCGQVFASEEAAHEAFKEAIS